jgi:hypothetical protein
MSQWLVLPTRRNYITPKVRITGRTFYISVHEGSSSWLSTAGVTSLPM